MQDFVDYKIKDTSLINSGEDNTIRVYTHNQKWKIVEDLEQNNVDNKNIILDEETKKRFKEFYKKEFIDLVHYKISGEVIVSDLELIEDTVYQYNDNYDWLQFKCIMQEKQEYGFGELKDFKLPVEQFTRQIEFLGIQEEIKDVSWNDYRQFLESDVAKEMYSELIDYFNRNFKKSWNEEPYSKELSENNVIDNSTKIYLFLKDFRQDYNSSYPQVKYKETSILDLFRFSDYSIDIFSNSTISDDYYYKSGPLHIQNNGTFKPVTDEMLRPWKFKEQYNDNDDNDIYQQEADNTQKNPEILQDKKIVCFSNYDINKLFGNNKLLEQIMDI